MHTEHHIEAPRSEAPDDHVAKLDRDMAGQEPRPAHPLSNASHCPPNCVHGMNSFADGRYHLALARLRRQEVSR
jgi:hypothetical protein